MNSVLVIDGGGRGHALVSKLAQSNKVERMWCAPGNAGIGMEKLTNGRAVECVDIGVKEITRLVEFAKKECPTLTVVGSDDSLALGVVNRFNELKLPIFGPRLSAARFEWSKEFAKNFMARHEILTAPFEVCHSYETALFAFEHRHFSVIKVDGLALGKGVFVCESVDEAKEVLNRIFVRKEFGEAGRSVVVEQQLFGKEASLHALCNGKETILFPSAQDYKRLLSGDVGPQTGGMGGFSPTQFCQNPQTLAEISNRIFDRWQDGCQKEGIDYRGILYPGIMVTNSGTYVLEFNARFGDPETQVYLTRLESDLFVLLMAIAEGKTVDPITWSSQRSVCVVMVSGGYPHAYEKGKVITGLDEVAKMSHVKVFHAGTKLLPDGSIVTNGGRVLGVTAWADTLRAARIRAYDAVQKIHFDGAYYRDDICSDEHI